MNTGNKKKFNRTIPNFGCQNTQVNHKKLATIQKLEIIVFCKKVLDLRKNSCYSFAAYHTVWFDYFKVR